MRPTPADALDGAERLLNDLVADGELSEQAAEPVVRLVRRARVGWSTRLPFLDRDNGLLVGLLTGLRPALPPELVAGIDTELAARSGGPVLDVEEAERQNVALRELLAASAKALPDGADRRRVLVYLLDRVERDPG